MGIWVLEALVDFIAVVEHQVNPCPGFVVNGPGSGAKGCASVWAPALPGIFSCVVRVLGLLA